MRKYLNLRSNIALGLIIAFLANTFEPLPVAQAQEFRLPAPGVMVPLSPEFNPPILKGIKVHPDNPFRFDFILDQGDEYNRHPEHSEGSQQEQLKQESTKLIKYFLASLTIPEQDLWVNLSPYEKNRIIPQSFGLTEMGRDLLAEDYMLKQITASLIYPEGETGKKFWKHIYEEAYKKFGTTNIPVNTFNKVWIVPEKAVVYENVKAGTAYVVEAKLKVILEQDYLAFEKNTVILSAANDLNKINSIRDSSATPQNDVNALGSQIVREIIIPELTKEVNQDKNFAQLRQVYNSLILATWYKKKIKDSILEQVYDDKNKIQGLVIPAKAGPHAGHSQELGIQQMNVNAIYQRYLQAFKEGVYNYIKEDTDPVSQQTVPRKYFSGGFSAQPLFNAAMTVVHKIDSAQLLSNEMKVTADFAMFKSNRAMNSNQVLFDAWSKGPDAKNELVYQARRLGFEGGIFELKGNFYYLKPFQGSLEDREFGPPLFNQYVHPILVTPSWHNIQPGEIWRNVTTYANSDAIFIWRKSGQGYECMMFDYGPGVVDQQRKPMEEIGNIFKYAQSYGQPHGSGLGVWLYGKYSYLTRLISVNERRIRVVDKKPGFFTDQEDIGDIRNKVKQTDVEFAKRSHGVIVHIFVPFNKEEYKGRFSAVTNDDVLGSVVTEQAPLEKDEIEQFSPPIEVLHLSANDVGRPVEITAHVSAKEKREVKVWGRIHFFSDPSFEIEPMGGMEDTKGVKGTSTVKLSYSQVRRIKTHGFEKEIISEKGFKEFIQYFTSKFVAWHNIPIGITYETEYDVGKLESFKGTIQEAPSPENQGTLKIKDTQGQELDFGVNRVNQLKFTDLAMRAKPTANQAMTGRDNDKGMTHKFALSEILDVALDHIREEIDITGRYTIHKPAQNIIIESESNMHILSIPVEELLRNAFDEHGQITIELSQFHNRGTIGITNSGPIEYSALRARVIKAADDHKLFETNRGIMILDPYTLPEDAQMLGFDINSVRELSPINASNEYVIRDTDLLFTYGLSLGKSRGAGETGGYGVGLFDVRKIMSSIKGSVEYRSNSKETTFELNFKVADFAMDAFNPAPARHRKMLNRKEGMGGGINGGIDLTPANMNLQVKMDSRLRGNDNGIGIKLHIDPAMLAELQNAQGFVPVIINIEPMTDLRRFLGVQ